MRCAGENGIESSVTAEQLTENLDPKETKKKPK